MILPANKYEPERIHKPAAGVNFRIDAVVKLRRRSYGRRKY